MARSRPRTSSPYKIILPAKFQLKLRFFCSRPVRKRRGRLASGRKPCADQHPERGGGRQGERDQKDEADELCAYAQLARERAPLALQGRLQCHVMRQAPFRKP